MSQRDEDDDIEAGEREPLARGHDDSQPRCALGCAVCTLLVSDRSLYRPTRSIHAMTRDEIRKGIANRVLHSRTYIILYLAMAALSITTVVLSMRDGCPGVAFYILEIIINSAMIAEVAIRFLAFGRVSETGNVLLGVQFD
jgi:cytochrome b561